MIGVLLPSLLTSALAACSTLPPEGAAALPESWCPTYAIVHGDSQPCGRLNIVFVSAGFTETELPTYRCAVDRMVTRLLQLPPFDALSSDLNVYRVDVASASSGISVDANCTALCRQKDLDLAAAWPSRDSECGNVPGGVSGAPAPVTKLWRADASVTQSCVDADFGLELCGFDRSVCRLLWPDDTDRVGRVALCAPGHDIVVVLANSAAHAGGGMDSPSIVVATLEGIGDATNRSNLLAHELGHAAGLLDEYDDTAVTLTYRSGANVAWEHDPGFPDSVPWKSNCTGSCGGSLEGCGRPASPGCLIVPDLNGDPPCCAPSSPQAECTSNSPGTEIGLWEGAVANRCGFFRSQQTCRMGGEVGQPFCQVCEDLIIRNWSRSKACSAPQGTGGSVEPSELRICIGPTCQSTFSPTVGWVDPARRTPSTDAEMLQELMGRDVIEFRAALSIDGFVGEIEIDSLRLSLEVPGRPGIGRTLTIRRIPAHPFDHLAWSLDGVPIAQGPSGEAARAALVAMRGAQGAIQATAVAGSRAVATSSVFLRTVGPPMSRRSVDR